jgi:DNA uptake protein ComE-like DNA-binding protein
MTSSNGDPPLSAHAISLLSDKNWRMKNSWWIFVPLLSCGFLGWLGFFVAGVRTGKKRYWIATAVYASLFALFFVLILFEGVWADIAMVPFLAVWIAPAVHAAILNRRYLTELASQEKWYAAPAGTSQPRAPQVGSTVLGVSSQEYYGPTAPAHPQPPEPSRPTTQTPPPPPPSWGGTEHTTSPHGAARERQESVNINDASLSELCAIPGVGQSLAQRLVAIRDARGGYRNMDDLEAAANLQPHELVRLRGAVTFDPSSSRQKGFRDEGNSGRILDI